ncbi:hypothetical protein ACTWPT_02340 [Nonomuraea sp. 3N208]|uniref:hypothetical protein n=1 Tax=Nonomuraea sp. 3N208 TaxID=3457421 RepID=UPI003FCE2AFC
MEEQRRWDNDERFTGASDAAAMLPAAPGWEVPGARLLEDGVGRRGGHGVASASVGDILAARTAG